MSINFSDMPLGPMAAPPPEREGLDSITVEGGFFSSHGGAGIQIAGVAGGAITGIKIINAGTGYISPPAVTTLTPFRTQLQNMRKQFSHLPKVLKALDTFEVMGAMAKNPAIEVFNTRIFGPLTALMYQAEPQGPYTFWGEEEDRYYNDAGQPLEMETQST